jgi:hypothetical protein
MKTRHEPCDPHPLKLLAEDRLPSAEVARLTDHLERCPRCRETLDQLVDSDRWLAVARHLVETGLSLSRDEVIEPDSTFPFLAPTDWPDSLGRL